MITTLSILILGAALALLAVLAVVDFRSRLLPNIYVAPFAILGVCFHALLDFTLIDPISMGLGALGGGGMLWLVRWGANAYYRTDTLGLGDVKLMAAGGIWLGLEHIFLAITIGAFFGVIHGIIVAWHTKSWDLRTLSIPAGPGFILGLLCVGGFKFFWT